MHGRRGAPLYSSLALHHAIRSRIQALLPPPRRSFSCSTLAPSDLPAERSSFGWLALPNSWLALVGQKTRYHRSTLYWPPHAYVTRHMHLPHQRLEDGPSLAWRGTAAMHMRHKTANQCLSAYPQAQHCASQALSQHAPYGIYGGNGIIDKAFSMPTG